MTKSTDFDLAKFAYLEVLDATKHQDDKIGRLLGAVAFLTGGALIFSNVDLLGATYALENSNLRLAALLVGSFLVLDLASVVLLVLAVVTPLRPPGNSGAEAETASGDSVQECSFLFFFSISKVSFDDWETRWLNASRDSTVEDKIYRNLIRETHNIAVRANSKYEQARLASKVLLASICFLVPALVIVLDTASRRPQSMDPFAWDPNLRVLVALGTAAITFILRFSQFQSTKRESRPQQNQRLDQRSRSHLALTVSAPVVVTSLIFVTPYEFPERMLGLGVVVIAGSLAFRAAFRLCATTNTHEAAKFVIASFLLAAIWTMALGSEHWALLTAILIAASGAFPEKPKESPRRTDHPDGTDGGEIHGTN